MDGHINALFIYWTWKNKCFMKKRVWRHSWWAQQILRHMISTETWLVVKGTIHASVCCFSVNHCTKFFKTPWLSNKLKWLVHLCNLFAMCWVPERGFIKLPSLTFTPLTYWKQGRDFELMMNAETYEPYAFYYIIMVQKVQPEPKHLIYSTFIISKLIYSLSWTRYVSQIIPLYLLLINNFFFLFISLAFIALLFFPLNKWFLLFINYPMICKYIEISIPKTCI